MDPLELAWLELCEGRDTGGGAFAAVAIPLVAAALPADRDPHLAEAAAAEAVLDLIQHPERYNPAKLGVFPYLRMAARRDLLNLLKKESKHHAGRESAERVEVAAADRNDGQDEPMTLDEYPPLAAAIAELSEWDRAVLALMRQGERATATFAAALGLTGTPAELAAEVKTVKDRIIARLKRAGRTA